MHLGIVTPEYPPAVHGGSGSSYRDLAEGMAELGHKVTVVGVYSKAVLDKLPPERNVTNLRVVRFPESRARFSYRLAGLLDRHRITRWLEREHRKTPFDIVECSDYAGWLRFGGPKSVATVVRIRGSNFFFDHELNRAGNSFEHQLEKRCLARASHLASVSHYAARRTLALCNSSNRPCEVIYNAVDSKTFFPAQNIQVEPGLIVFANVLNPKKGIEQLIDAMNIVAPKHPEARLAVIGHDAMKKTNGKSYVDQLRERLLPEFRARVIFTGRLDRHQGVLPYLQRAHLCCYPSHMETFGIAPLEAMAVGKPTIFSNTGPGPEIVEDGISGLLCDPFSPQDIADKISRLLEDHELATRLASNARNRVLTTFNKTHWIGKNLKFYENCIATLNRN